MAISRSATMLPFRRAMASVAKHVEAPAEVVQKKPGTGHPKKNNLFDVARLLPSWGIGHKVAKTHWQPQTYYKIYDVKLGKSVMRGPKQTGFFLARSLGRMPGMELPGGYTMNKVLMRGGAVICQSVEAGKLQKISGANKRCWKYVADERERSWEHVASHKAPKEATMEVLVQ